MPTKKTSRKMTGKTTAVKAKAVTKAKAKTKAVKPKISASLKAPLNKTQLLTELADRTGLNKKQIGSLFDTLSDIIAQHVKPRSVGEFTMPGILKIKVVNKPATKARKGINPFTGQETMFKAKPARNVVKIKALKRLKDQVS